MSFYSRIASDDTIYKYVDDEATNALRSTSSKKYVAESHIILCTNRARIRQFIIAKELQGCIISVVLTIMQRMAGLQES
jgi:hypothetical protein